jgi:integrase/recombinase XerD
MGTEGIEPSRLSAHDPKSASRVSVAIISEFSAREYPIMSNQRMTRDALRAWVEGFLRDCRARDLSAHTVEYYRAQLADFEKFVRLQDATAVTDITPDLIRGYLLHLAESGHNPGGRHAKYRALRAFLRWYQAEAEPDASQWKNPIEKVRPPKVTVEPIPGVSIEDIRALLSTCKDGFTGVRDRALLLALLDTGARAGEFLAVDLSDVDTIGGSVILRKTKAKKTRTVYIGRKARRALRAYLKQREDESAALWVTST